MLHMDVGESPSKDRNLRNSSIKVLLNFTPLALNTGSGPGRDNFRETSPAKRSQDQPTGRTNPRVREVVKSLRNSAVELNWNQRNWRSCREVTEDRRGSIGNRVDTERSEDLSWKVVLHGRVLGKINGWSRRKRLEGGDR